MACFRNVKRKTSFSVALASSYSVYMCVWGGALRTIIILCIAYSSHSIEERQIDKWWWAQVWGWKILGTSSVSLILFRS